MLHLIHPALVHFSVAFISAGGGAEVAGMIALLVPFANLLLGPALVAGGTLLVLALEPLGSTDGSPATTEAGVSPAEEVGEDEPTQERPE